MKLAKILARGAVAAAVTFGVVAATSTTASAYVACNRAGDCWHTDTRIHLPGISLNFHDDNWWTAHQHDRRYSHFVWHDSDAGHDWHHGYWDHGVWHNS